MDEGLGGDPFPQAALEKRVFEVLAPEGGEGHPGLAEAAIEIQHAHQAGPLAGPVGDGKDGAAVRLQAGKQVRAVLPDGLGDDNRRIGMNVLEDAMPMRWL